MAAKPKSDLLKTETGVGLILAIAAFAGLVAANSPLSVWYFHVLHTQVPVSVGAWSVSHDVIDWIKEGLLAVFFFVVGLEIKFEVVKGELSSPRRLAMPLVSAAGGMIVPALIYLAINASSEGRPEGWPIPVATDIVFALAALAAFGARAPPSLRSFLLALAVVDDLGAVLLIAVLFTGELNPILLGAAAAVIAGMALLGLTRRPHAVVYAVGAVVVWALTLNSGIATSVGAVAAALTVPVSQRRPGQPGLAHEMTEALRPYVSYGILPLFAFAASGFSFAALSVRDLASPVALGVAAALLIGKPVGVFGASWLAVRLNVGQRPSGANWTQLFAAALLCGVGFTMSLYLAGLAFDEGSEVSAAARLGVMAGSIGATALGALLLSVSGRSPKAPRPSPRSS